MNDVPHTDNLESGSVVAEKKKKLISVFVCGVQKGGTTSLDAYFCMHPDLSPAIRKELHYFNDETVNWKTTDHSVLDGYYSANDGNRLRFDISPIYMFWPRSIERIKAYNPDAKLIFLFRDPIERARSNWFMEFSRGKETLSFGEAIRDGRKRLEGLPDTSKKRRIFSYVERGLYAGQIRRVLENFSREQLLFLRSEDFVKDHITLLSKISSFLGISPFPERELIRKHRRRGIDDSRSYTEEDRALIHSIIHDDVLEFAKLTGIDVSDWPSAQELP